MPKFLKKLTRGCVMCPKYNSSEEYKWEKQLKSGQAVESVDAREEIEDDYNANFQGGMIKKKAAIAEAIWDFEAKLKKCAT